MQFKFAIETDIKCLVHLSHLILVMVAVHFNLLSVECGWTCRLHTDHLRRVLELTRNKAFYSV